MHSIALFVSNKPLCELLAIGIDNSRAFTLTEALGGLALFQSDGQSAFAIELADEELAYYDFQCLSKDAEKLAVSASAKGAIAYLETEYFGGDGAQTAIVWDEGKVVYGPCVRSEGTINAALRILGVEAKRGQDEFLTVGLGLVSSNEDFFKDHC